MAVPQDPLGPLEGAVNVTDAPATGFPPESVNVTCNGVVNAVFTGFDCPLPAVGVMEVAPAPWPR